MYKKTVTVVNETGLHARPATEFVSAAKGFKSKIEISCMDGEDELRANAKSIVMLLGLGAGQGTEVTLSAEGEDERDAVEALASLIESGFGEM